VGAFDQLVFAPFSVLLNLLPKHTLVAKFADDSLFQASFVMKCELVSAHFLAAVLA